MCVRVVEEQTPCVQLRLARSVGDSPLAGQERPDLLADLADQELWTAENVGVRAVAAVARLAYDTLLRLAAMPG